MPAKVKPNAMSPAQSAPPPRACDSEQPPSSEPDFELVASALELLLVPAALAVAPALEIPPAEAPPEPLLGVPPLVLFAPPPSASAPPCPPPPSSDGMQR